MYEVFLFYSLFIYGEKPHLEVMKTNEDGVRVSTIVCSKRLVSWGVTGEEALEILSKEAVRLIIEDNRPYDYFEQSVWGME